MVIDQKFVGKEYPTIQYEVSKEKIKEFARAIKADPTLFENICPPTFPVVYSTELLANVLYDEEMKLNLRKLVHGEQEFLYHKPVRPGDIITSSGSVVKIFQKGPHDFISFKIESKNQNNELACESFWTLIVRGGNDKDFSLKEKLMMELASLMPSSNDNYEYKGNRADGVYYKDLSDNEKKLEVLIDKYRPQIYAGASGDFNAIHLDAKLGKSVGLGGYILHGMATMAFGANLAMKFKDLETFKRYRVRFSAPVKPLDTLYYHAKLGNNKLEYTAKNQAGIDVLNSCVIEFN